MKKFVIVFATAVLLMGFTGCSYLFYPRASDFAEQAKGATTVETLFNLITMMETSAQAAKGGSGEDQALDDLHNQFHAFNDMLCCVEEAKRETPLMTSPSPITRNCGPFLKGYGSSKIPSPNETIILIYS